MPAGVFAWANGLRSEHFPRERNHLVAHVTLFHSFAPSLREELRGIIGRYAARFAAPAARIEGLMDLGSGTALRVHSPGMAAIREEIAEHFHGALTSQDGQPLRLHITVQNKVPRAAAKALQAELGPALKPREFTFTGLGLHLYRNPHWEPQGIWKFHGKEHG